MSDSKKYFFPLAVVCILVVIFLVRCGKGSNANNISFTTEQQEEIKTIVALQKNKKQIENRTEK